jgi:hypothetical protein
MESMRVEQRYRTYAKVRCQKYGAGTGSLMILKNVSRSGALLNLITATSEFLRGDILRLVVELDSVNSARTVNAEVIWSKGGAVGVSFLMPDAVVTKLLSRSLE